MENSFTSIMPKAYCGSVTHSDEALKIIDTTDTGQRELNRILNLRIYDKQSINGKMKNGLISFFTIEGYYRLFLLKLSSENMDVYIIANFFGGCNRNSVLLWNERPQVIRK